MRVKQDAIPGMSIPLWFVPTRMGDWQIACAQLCGNSHFKMKGIFKIQNENKFNSWLTDRVPTLGEEGEEVW